MTTLRLSSSFWIDLDLAGDLGDLGLAFRLAGLEQLDDSRQTVGDVTAGDTAAVEGTHGQLGARLADRLGGDDADRVAQLGQFAGGQVAAVTVGADADLSLALEHRTHRHDEAFLVAVDLVDLADKAVQSAPGLSRPRWQACACRVYPGPARARAGCR